MSPLSIMLLSNHELMMPYDELMQNHVYPHLSLCLLYFHTTKVSLQINNKQQMNNTMQNDLLCAAVPEPEALFHYSRHSINQPSVLLTSQNPLKWAAASVRTQNGSNSCFLVNTVSHHNLTPSEITMKYTNAAASQKCDPEKGSHFRLQWTFKSWISIYTLCSLLLQFHK